MKFQSPWITTEDFIGLPPLDMYHKQFEQKCIPESQHENYHVCFRKKLFLQDCEDIHINISADDYYKLYINGSFVCQGPACAYPECYSYNSINISRYLASGENVIAIHVFYHGRINRAYFSGDNRMGLVADIYSGDEFICGTDESWIYKRLSEFSGETIGYDTQFLENIDFTKKDRHFKEADADESEYKKAVANSADDHVFIDTPTPTVDVYSVKPKEIIKIEDGKYLIDFGTELSGQFYMKIKGRNGQKVRIMCGEELLENSLYVRYEMRCNCTYDETLTLSGNEDEVEFFDYKMFRYVNVFTDSDFDTSSVCAIVRHHKFEEKITVSSKIPHIKEIWDICKNAVRYGAQEALLDCPSREKGAYLGDFTISGPSHYYLTGDKEYFKKNLYDYAHTAKISRGLMAVANASYMQELADFSLLYPLQVLNYLKLTGDADAAKELYPLLVDLLHEFSAYERADGLLDNVKDKLNLVDWPENYRDGYNARIDAKYEKSDCHNVLNAFYIGAHKAVEELAQILGIKHIERAQALSCQFIKAFYNPHTGLFCDTEDKTHSAIHSNALPLFFGIVLPEMQECIKNFIMEKGLCCGVYMSYFVLKALARIGAYEEELKLLINESSNSWVNMINEGATTCYEAWGKEQKWNTSLCHPWASAPIIVICEDLNGKCFDEGEISVESIF